VEEIGVKGSIGFSDGSYTEARFNRLQGVAYQKTGDQKKQSSTRKKGNLFTRSFFQTNTNGCMSQMLRIMPYAWSI